MNIYFIVIYLFVYYTIPVAQQTICRIVVGPSNDHRTPNPVPPSSQFLARVVRLAARDG